MKNILYITIILMLSFGCSRQKKEEAQAIINQSIAVHGCSVLKEKNVSFDFRDKHYSVSRTGNAFLYTRSFQDSTGFVLDSLVNSTRFSRHIEGLPVSISEEWKAKYGRSINSVLYFFQLPYPLNDVSVQKEYMGKITFNGEPYHAIKITFEAQNGGEDFQDEYRYWIHAHTFFMDYLAYNYQDDEGGTRFRQAINRRTIEGLTVQDYINFEPDERFPPLDSLPSYFEKGRLSELSRILNENVQVN
ncbi:MAG: hypothetical protein OEY56_10065 [Cyclobacteriaceae bacterium]|nr:hypothetical protein [Cyclobacteriaceae bacterium]